MLRAGHDSRDVRIRRRERRDLYGAVQRRLRDEEQRGKDGRMRLRAALFGFDVELRHAMVVRGIASESPSPEQRPFMRYAAMRQCGDQAMADSGCRILTPPIRPYWTTGWHVPVAEHTNPRPGQHPHGFCAQLCPMALQLQAPASGSGVVTTCCVHWGV